MYYPSGKTRLNPRLFPERGDFTALHQAARNTTYGGGLESAVFGGNSARGPLLAGRQLRMVASSVDGAKLLAAPGVDHPDYAKEGPSATKVPG